jgi:hypothetical protein
LGAYPSLAVEKNGKIDRKKLEDGRRSVDERNLLPQMLREQSLAVLFCYEPIDQEYRDWNANPRYAHLVLSFCLTAASPPKKG